MPDSEPALRRYWLDHASFDPSQSAPVRARVLGLYGTLDRSSPMPQSAVNLSMLLDRSANVGSSVVILPNVNHQMLDAHTRYDDELLGLSDYSVPYLRTLVRFIESI
jgi:pimeloyl-ACP methyl ester carboxylesterase